jgi:hypothetical protein
VLLHLLLGPEEIGAHTQQGRRRRRWERVEIFSRFSFNVVCELSDMGRMAQ